VIVACDPARPLVLSIALCTKDWGSTLYVARILSGTMGKPIYLYSTTPKLQRLLVYIQKLTTIRSIWIQNWDTWSMDLCAGNILGIRGQQGPSSVTFDIVTDSTLPPRHSISRRISNGMVIISNR
jgi:hypothetical protein